MSFNILDENVWSKLQNFSKNYIFLIFSFGFCSIIFIWKLFRRTSVISPVGKAVLITGCDSGFGYQLALRLNSSGYRVYATVLRGDSTANLIQKSEYKNQMIVWKMDVTDDEEVKEVYLKVKHDLEGNDCILWSVVNNAGYGILAQLEWVDLDDYKRIFEVNVFGMVRVTKMFLPLIRQSKGRIVYLSSILGLETLNGYGVYCMTKYAVTAFCRTLRREVNKFNIKVIVLYPGGYKNTNFVESSFKSCDKIWDQMDESLKNSYGSDQYLKRWKSRQTFSFDHLMSDKTYLVVNDMIEGITSSHPKNEYKPIGWIIGQIMAFFLPIVPNFLADALDSY